MTLNGPILTHEKVADSIEWAQSLSSGKVLMALNGPILTHEKVADSIEWAQSCSSGKVSMTLNGPILTHEKVADGIELAQLLRFWTIYFAYHTQTIIRTASFFYLNLLIRR